MSKLTYEDRILRLKSTSRYGRRAPAFALGEVLTHVFPAIRGAVCMRMRGRSAFTGTQPRWFKRATDVRVAGISGKGYETCLHLKIPSLGSAAPELYEQLEFWSSQPDQSATGIELLATVISEVNGKNSGSELLDRNILGSSD